MDINGNAVSFSDMPRGFKTPKLLNCERREARTGLLCDAIPPITKVMGFLAQSL